MPFGPSGGGAGTNRLGKQILSDSTAITVAALGYFTVPSWLDGHTVTAVELLLSAAPTGNAVAVSVTNAASHDLFSTNPTVDVGGLTSALATTPPVIDPTYATVAEGDLLTVNGVTADASATDAGLTVVLTF